MSLTKVTYSMILGAPKNVKDFGATGDGTTDDTAAIRLALIGGGAIYFPAGTYLVKDATNIAGAVVLAPASDSVLFGEGDLSILKLGAHSTIKHNIFRLDNKQNITICELKLDGNKAQQTGTFGGFPDEYSHAIRIVDGSQNVTVENCTIIDAKGDGVYVGYENDVTGETSKVYINNNIAYGSSRQQLTVTHGTEITFSNNRLIGAIDVEADAVAGTRIAGVKIIGNTGIVENFALTTSMLSNALINIYSPDGQGYKLNDISVIDNTVYSIQVQYAYGLRIIGNNVIGSNNTQSNLVYVRGSEFVAITGNNFVANYAVATGLQCCVDQYCNNNYVCSGNTADNSGGVAFSRNVTGTVGTVTSDPVKIFINNNALSGIYSTVSETESAFNAVAMFRLSIVGSATPTFTFTQMSGQPVNMSATISGSYELRLTNNVTDSFYEFLPICSATVASGATAFNDAVNVQQTYNPASNSYTAFLLYTAAANAATTNAFNLTSASGTFFFRVYF